MIHPTAIIDPNARLGAGVTVGAYAVIRANVTVGDNCRIGEHSLIEGPTQLGKDNTLHPFCVVGTAPQDLKHDPSHPTRLEMGDGNIVREFVTINRGTHHGGGVTRVGNRCLFMAYSHVAHDCQLGSNIVMANSAQLAGHVTIEDFAILGGLVGAHQFTRIGESAMLGGGAMVGKDVPPFFIAQGDRARLIGINSIGLKRRGFSEEDLDALGRAARALIKSRTTLEKTLDQIENEWGSSPKVRQLVAFMRAAGDRGVMFKD